jgi:hypothetical protein
MPDSPTKPDQLEGGAYEVIRARLNQHAATLRKEAESPDFT